ncbi:MAG TPA: hypothetical protein VGM60_23365 [Pseudonocardia sp.]|jgi:hypothetical protein|uniref:WXG100 family type VII secretion target n=1 Tax=Pseudonocardia sp. TaxID=60912 RepID=UPI002F42A1A2
MSAVHPAPASASEAVAAATAGGPGSFKVTTEALLNARNIIQTEYDRLSERLNRYSSDLVVQDCGTDPVSPHASAGFNEKIGLIVHQANAYVQSLQDAIKQLDHTLHGYDTTDDQIRASFKAYQDNHPTAAQPASALPKPMAPINPLDPAASLRQYIPAITPGDLRPPTAHPAPGPVGGSK